MLLKVQEQVLVTWHWVKAIQIIMKLLSSIKRAAFDEQYVDDVCDEAKRSLYFECCTFYFRLHYAVFDDFEDKTNVKHWLVQQMVDFYDDVYKTRRTIQ